MVCSFLILTIYPEVKDYHLHFTEGKKEITKAILCSALSSPSLRPQVAARTVTLRAGTSSLSPQSSRDHSRTSRECWAQVGITGWPPTWKSLQLQTRPRVRQSDTKTVLVPGRAHLETPGPRSALPLLPVVTPQARLTPHMVSSMLSWPAP